MEGISMISWFCRTIQGKIFSKMTTFAKLLLTSGEQAYHKSSIAYQRNLVRCWDGKWKWKWKWNCKWNVLPFRTSPECHWARSLTQIPSSFEHPWEKSRERGICWYNRLWGLITILSLVQHETENWASKLKVVIIVIEL